MTGEESLALAVVRLFQQWEVPDDIAIAIMGGRDASADEVLDRTVLLLCIEDALSGIFTDPARARQWLRNPNTIFEGQPPLQFMAGGTKASIARVKDYLYAECYG